jgi:hypothetical protein
MGNLCSISTWLDKNHYEHNGFLRFNAEFLVVLEFLLGIFVMSRVLHTLLFYLHKKRTRHVWKSNDDENLKWPSITIQVCFYFFFFDF